MGSINNKEDMYASLWMDELSAFTGHSRILQTWRPEAYMDKGTFSRIFKVVNRYTGEIGVLKYVPNPLESEDARAQGTVEERFHHARYETSKREAEIMNHFRGVQGIVQYTEEPEYVERTYFNSRGERVVQYAVLICMPMYINHKEWFPKLKGDWERRIQLGMDIASALSRFEKEGVYHRDIKPGNILMDGEGRFYLADVGEAKLESELTTTGFHGTRPYMAPEVYQLEKQGAKARSDHRSDLYSLGIILYRLFNQQQFPFLNKEGTLTEAATESYRAYEKKTNTESDSVYITDSERARLLRYDGAMLPKPKEADPQLSEVILRACAYDREERYQKAEDLYKALQCCLEGKKLPEELRLIVPAQAEKKTGKGRSKKRPIQRSDYDKKEITGSWQTWVIVVCLVLLLAAAGLIFLISAGGRSPSGDGNTYSATPTPGVMVTAAAVYEVTATPEVVPTATPMPTATPTAEPTPMPTATPTLVPTATPTSVPTATPTLVPTIAPTPSPTAVPTLLENYACTVKANVQVRSNPSEGAILQAVLRSEGMPVELIGWEENENSIWYLIECEGSVGYVRADNLRAMTIAELWAYTVTPTPEKKATPTPTKKPTPTPTKKPTPKPTPKPTKKPTPTPTKKPTSTPDTRGFELNPSVVMNRGNATFSWTDRENLGPYEVSYSYYDPGSSAVQCNFWAGGNQEGSTTTAKSFTIDGVIPGRQYYVTVEDRNGKSTKKLITLPAPSTFVDGKLKASSVDITTGYRYRANDSVDYKRAQKLNRFDADEMMKDIKNGGCYGIYYKIKFPRLATSRTYNTSFAFYAPNGFAKLEAYGDLEYSCFNNASWSTMEWYSAGEYFFELLYQKNNTIPVGRYTIELYWDGMLVNTSYFNVQ